MYICTLICGSIKSDIQSSGFSFPRGYALVLRGCGNTHAVGPLQLGTEKESSTTYNLNLRPAEQTLATSTSHPHPTVPSATMAPVCTQPTASAMPAQFCGSYYDDEKYAQQCEQHFVSDSACGCSQTRSHRACHKARLRKMLGPIVLVLLALVTILVVWCMSDMGILEAIFAGDGNPLHALGKRQSSSSSFTNNKREFYVPGFPFHLYLMTRRLQYTSSSSSWGFFW